MATHQQRKGPPPLQLETIPEDEEETTTENVAEGPVLPPFVPLLIDILHHGATSRKYRSNGKLPPMRQTTQTASWNAVVPSPVQSSAGSIPVLPGLFIDRQVSAKRAKHSRDSPVGVSIPPSLMKLMGECAARKNGKGSNISLYSPVSDGLLTAKTVNNAVKALSVQLLTGLEDRRHIDGRISLSRASHNERQLEFNRVSLHHPTVAVPLCCNGVADNDCACSHLSCSADRLPLRQGSLCMYLTPEQQRMFDATGELPPIHGECFICICRNVMEHVMLSSNDPNPEVQSGRYVLVPPFSVPINQHDGYKAECCVAPSAVMAAHVPKGTHGLFVEYHPERGTWRVNQSAILWSPSPPSHLN